MQFVIQLILTLALLALGFGVGRYRERQHFADLRRREERTRGMMTLPTAKVPEVSLAEDSSLVSGSVVVSLDYFKRFVAGLRNLVGGRVAAYESLLERARREAVLRMKEDALRQGYHAVVNVRVESARLASALQDGKGTSGVEVLAYGTALRLPAHAAARRSLEA